MDHSAAPIFDAPVNYRAHGRYRCAPPDTVRAAMRMREPAPRSARMRSTRASSPRRGWTTADPRAGSVPGWGADGRRGRRGDVV